MSRFIVSFSQDLSEKHASCGSSLSACPLSGSKVQLRGDNYRHAVNVLRLRPGDEVELLNSDSGEVFAAQIESIASDTAMASISSKLELAPVHKLSLVAALVKPKICDFIVEKCVELGVSSFHFFEAERSQGSSAPSKEQVEKRSERLGRVAASALKQSGFNQGALPQIALHESLGSVLTLLHAEALKGTTGEWRLALHPYSMGKKSLNFVEFAQESSKGAVQGTEKMSVLGSPPSSATLLEKAAKNDESYLIIGPEGGLTNAELECAKTHGYVFVSLGPKVLRAETSALLACGLIELLRTRS